MEVLQAIVQWNIDRKNNGYPSDELVLTTKIEEMFEFLGLHKAVSKEIFKHIVKRYVDQFLFEAKSYGSKPTIYDRIDSLCDDTVLNTGFIHRYKYDPVFCMQETIKEISSRKQDPEQAKEWAENGVSGKWAKDPKQCSETLYTAEYSLGAYK